MAMKKQPSWYKAVTILALLLLIVMIMSGCASLLVDSESTGTVARIPVHGTIQIGGSDFFSDASVADANRIVSWIQNANEDELVEVILLDINSGGGSPVASAEIAQAVQDSQKPVVAQIREVGASGAYWIASAADIIYAHPLSTTGSIGVIGSYLELDGLLADYNVTYNRQVSGEYKDLGSPFKEMTEDEQVLYGQTLDRMHEYFIAQVAANRNVSVSSIEELATGQIYLGLDAVDNGLVDMLGSSTDVEDYIALTYNVDVSYKEYTVPTSIFDSFSSFSSSLGKNIGVGLGESLQPNVRT
jgi:protease-4